jgi:hypothetical protein
MRTHVALVVLIAGALAAPACVWGQSRSSGMFGSSSIGRSGPTSSMGGMGSMGMGGMSGMGTSGMGMSGMSGMGSYGSGFIGASAQNNAGLLGGIMSSAYGGRSSSMYGSSLGGMSRMGSSGYGGMGQTGYGRTGYGNSPYGAYGNTASGAASPGVAKKLSLDYTVAATPGEGPGPVNTELSGRLGALPSLHTNSPITVAIQGETATLRGVVATQHDRDLAARVLLLEPRISAVVNELVVAPPAASTPPTH